MSPVRTLIDRSEHSFDYYVRSITTSMLAIAIVGATIYKEITGNTAPQLLIAWGGIVVGVYFGYTAATNGVVVRRQIRKQVANAITGEQGGQTESKEVGG
jgi:hypothetical protein